MARDMAPPRVGVIGYNAVGKRLADAVAAHPDLQLAGIYETDAARRQMIAALSLPLVEGDLTTSIDTCDVLAVCEGSAPETDRPMVVGPDVRVDEQPRALQIRCADAVAFQRLAAALPAAERWFSSCARRSIDAGVDAMTPQLGPHSEDRDLQAAFKGTPILVRRTLLPYTQSHVHHLKIDLVERVDREAVVERLRQAPRIRVRRGSQGFANTGQVQEFDRDIGRRRGDRSEVFVWEETIAIVERTLFLTIDVSPDATVIPEMLDAIQRQANPDLESQVASRLTDRVRGLKE